MNFISVLEAVTPEAANSAPHPISIWAVLFGVLLLAVIIYIIYNLTIRNGEKKMAEQIAQMERDHKRELDEQKQRILTSLSQDLRAPISFIIGPLQQMAEENLSDDVKGRIQMILRNAQILLHHVNMLPVGVRSGNVASIMPATTPFTPPVTKPAEPSAPTSSDRQQRAEDERRTKDNVPQKKEEEQPTKEDEQPTTDHVEATGVDDNNAAAVANLQEDNLQETPAQHRFTMLMVDDSADMCRFVRDYFRGEYNVITAANGEQAIKCLEQNDNIDLVVSDVTMPKMDGFELCKFIKTDLRWSHIPVILLTGHTGEQMEMEGLKLGADDYITKPFNVEMLRLRVKKFIEKKENRQRQFREKIDVAPSEITITSVDEQFIQHAIKICEDHISDTEFSVEVLGRELSLSRTYLYKKLVNITGKGPGEFIRTIRMKRGKQYLEKTSMQITEIASELGYNSPKRFTENFKSEYGMSPSEYARKYRAERSSVAS